MFSVLRAQAEDAVQTARFLAMKTKTQISGTLVFYKSENLRPKAFINTLTSNF